MIAQYPHVSKWIDEVVSRLTPDSVIVVRGDLEERRAVSEMLVTQGVFTPLNPHRYPNSFWCRSDPSDVARVEDRTFICSRNPEDAGPTNNWRDPSEMYRLLESLLKGCMKGRTMYVVPYLMGPDGSPYSRVGFEITDSAYVVANMYIMARVGDIALRQLNPSSTTFIRGIHSIGDLSEKERYICHFPEDKTIISVNSNYGGNALQGKKCFALRIASLLAKQEGWLAEHMLILGITNPEGVKHYICAAFPSACGKTNLAMLVPPQSYRDAGWRVETVGDDIAWLHIGPDGRVYAINPEAGFFGVAPGTSEKTNPNAMATLRSNTIFTNTALDPAQGVPWWEGMGDPPGELLDWLGKSWTPKTESRAAHPNSRFTSPASQCPSIDPNWESPMGVPISAIVFGGRRARTMPLVCEAWNWAHGVFLGVTMASETTAAAAGDQGVLRRDPMAMLPFIGYHAGDYFAHWLSMEGGNGSELPKIFHVNWFRRGNDNSLLWPGFGENMRVLEWIVNRVEDRVGAEQSAIGLLPRRHDINCEGLSITDTALDALLAVSPAEWVDEIRSQREFFERIGPKMPEALWIEHRALKARVGLEAVD